MIAKCTAVLAPKKVNTFENELSSEPVDKGADNYLNGFFILLLTITCFI
jgi:hypothetical protein